MELDSNSDFFFNSVMNNHKTCNELFENNEFLRENNFSRPTNDVSDIPFFSEESNSPRPFDNIFENRHSDDLDSTVLFYNDNNNEITNNNEQSDNNTINNNIEKLPEPIPQPHPQTQPQPQLQTQPQNQNQNNTIITSHPFIIKKDNTTEITSGLTFLSYIALIFTFFGLKKPKGRTSNYLKDNPNYNHNPQHSKFNMDNFKSKVIRRCFKEIGKIIYNLCLAFGTQYKINSMDKKDKISTKKEILQLCNRTMVDLFVNNKKRNSSKNSPDTNHNRIIYDILAYENKINQSPLLSRIFDMTFGEVLYKFINDDNFANNIDPNYNFKTFSECFGNEYSDELLESAQQNMRKLLGKLYV